jgi:hypothetical protein
VEVRQRNDVIQLGRLIAQTRQRVMMILMTMMIRV